MSFMFVIIFTYGIIRINTFEEDGSPISVAITQPNINPDEKWDTESRDQNFALMHALLDSALILNPDLILWPESALPAYLRISHYRRYPIVAKLAKYNIPLLTGTVDRIIDANNDKIYYKYSLAYNV